MLPAMYSYLSDVSCLIFVLISLKSLSPAFSGCTTKDSRNKVVVIADNDTFADDSWWYRCAGTTLTAQGCVLDGNRVNIGDYFYAYSNAFYGVCEKVDDRYLKANLKGCADITGAEVAPGHPYVVDRYFWANCTSTKKTIRSPTLGDVDLDVIGRKIIGCNDGTYDIISDGDNFPDIRTNRPLLAGIGVICRLSGPFPQVQPVVCLVANGTESTYVALGDQCYGEFGKYLYYCSIKERAFRNGMSEYSWAIGWNDTSPANLAAVKAKSFHDCQNQPAQSQNATATASRRKRDGTEGSPLSAAFSTIERHYRVHGWLEASSKFIET